MSIEEAFKTIAKTMQDHGGQFIPVDALYDTKNHCGPHAHHLIFSFNNGPYTYTYKIESFTDDKNVTYYAKQTEAKDIIL